MTNVEANPQQRLGIALVDVLRHSDFGIRISRRRRALPFPLR